MKTAAILGLGKRGQTWAEAFHRAGWTVRGFDPDPSASQCASQNLPWKPSETISGAVAKADWVVISLPERLELMQKVIQRAQAESSAQTIISVATKAFGVDDIQACALRPSSVVVAHAREDGGFSIDVSKKTSAAFRAVVEQVLAELAAHVSLVPGASEDRTQSPSAETA